MADWMKTANMFKFRRQKVSDEEYVEQIRRNLANSRRSLLGFGVLFLSGFCVIACLVSSAIRDSAGFFPSMDGGFRIGMLLGLLIGLFLFKAIFFLCDAVWLRAGARLSRMPELLLKYHDLAKAGKKQQTDQPL